MNKKILLPLGMLSLLLPSCTTTSTVVDNDYLIEKVLSQAEANLKEVTKMKVEVSNLEDMSAIYPKNMRPFVSYDRTSASSTAEFYSDAILQTMKGENETGTNVQRFVTKADSSTLTAALSDSMAGMNYLGSHNEIKEGANVARFDSLDGTGEGSSELTKEELFDSYVETIFTSLGDSLTQIDHFDVTMDGQDVVLTSLVASTKTGSNPIYPNDSEKNLPYGTKNQITYRFQKDETYRLVQIESENTTQYFMDSDLKKVSAVVKSSSTTSDFTYGEKTSYQGELPLPDLEKAIAKIEAPTYLISSTAGQQTGTVENDRTIGYQLMTGEEKLCYTTTIDLTAFAEGATISFAKGETELNAENSRFVIADDLPYTNPVSGEYHFEDTDSLEVEIVTDMDGTNAVVTIA